MKRDWKLVEHEPVWEPSDLSVNAAGDTRPGFICVHELENGSGPCLGNVFRLEDAIGTHTCVVYEENGEDMNSNEFLGVLINLLNLNEDDSRALLSEVTDVDLVHLRSCLRATTARVDREIEKR